MNKYKIILITILLLLISAQVYEVNAKKVRGIVLNLQNNQPVLDVIVTLLTTDFEVIGLRITDSTGYFSFNIVQLDSFYLHTTRLDYVRIEAGPFNISRRDSITIILKIEQQPIILSEVVVEDEVVDRLLSDVGFNSRKKLGDGKFFTRSEIREKEFSSLISLMRTLPGISIRREGPYQVTYSHRSSGSLTGDARFQIYIDGVLLDDAGGNILEMINVEDVMGIEIYKSSTSAPIQFSRGKYGGVILIWTGYH